jgi:hypothetical protein
LRGTIDAIGERLDRLEASRSGMKVIPGRPTPDQAAGLIA